MTREEAIETCVARNAAASEADKGLWVPRRLPTGEWGVATLPSRRRSVEGVHGWQPRPRALSSGLEPIEHGPETPAAVRIRRSRRIELEMYALLGIVAATVPATAIWLVITITQGDPSGTMRFVFGGISLICIAVGAWWLWNADVFALDSADIQRRVFHVRPAVADAKIPMYEHRNSVAAGVVIGLGCAGVLAAVT